MGSRVKDMIAQLDAEKLKAEEDARKRAQAELEAKVWMSSSCLVLRRVTGDVVLVVMCS